MGARHVVMAAALVSALTGCSSPPSQATPNAPIAQSPDLPACATVFQPGKVVDKAQATAGCTSPSGSVQVAGFSDCKDGTVLWQVDATTGAPAGFAREGQPYQTVEGEAAADPGYNKAYEACAA
jgi:hypothetical protein